MNKVYIVFYNVRNGPWDEDIVNEIHSVHANIETATSTCQLLTQKDGETGVYYDEWAVR